MEKKINQCVFCCLDKDEKVIFKTQHFVFLESKFPLIPGHCLLLSKRHIRKEIEILKEQWSDYLDANKKAAFYIKKKYKKEAFVFINPLQQQSIKHFHKHFMPGVFGVFGVESALKKFLNK